MPITDSIWGKCNTTLEDCTPPAILLTLFIHSPSSQNTIHFVQYVDTPRDKQFRENRFCHVSDKEATAAAVPPPHASAAGIMARFP